VKEKVLQEKDKKEEEIDENLSSLSSFLSGNFIY
jgi:hypothetical protein